MLVIEIQEFLIYHLFLLFIEDLMAHSLQRLNLDIPKPRLCHTVQGSSFSFLPSYTRILASCDHQDGQICLHILIQIRLADVCDQTEQSVIASECKGDAAERILGVGADIFPAYGEPVQGRSTMLSIILECPRAFLMEAI